MFERFTDRARRVLVLAQEEARLRGHGWIGTEHLLLGLLRAGGTGAARVLGDAGVTLDSARHEVGLRANSSPAYAGGSSPLTDRAKKVLELSLREALQLGHNYIDAEHVLLGLIREGEGVAVQVLLLLGVDHLGELRWAVIEEIDGTVPAGAPRRPSVLSRQSFAEPPAADTSVGQVIELSLVDDKVVVTVEDPGLASLLRTALPGAGPDSIRSDEPRTEGFSDIWVAIAQVVRRLANDGPKDHPDADQPAQPDGDGPIIDC